MLKIFVKKSSIFQLFSKIWRFFIKESEEKIFSYSRKHVTDPRAPRSRVFDTKIDLKIHVIIIIILNINFL